MFKLKKLSYLIAVGSAFTASLYLPSVVLAAGQEIWQGEPFGTLSAQQGAPTPDAIDFQILSADCAQTSSWEFLMNGISLGNYEGACTDGSGVLTFQIAPDALAAAPWEMRGNVLQAIQMGTTPMSVSSVKAIIKLLTDDAPVYTYLNRSLQPQ